MFLHNRKYFYFHVDSSVAVNPDLLEGCTIFPDEDSLLDAVATGLGLTLEEIESGTFFVSQKKGQPIL
tara:strand:+ start:621 stop:824 length:204 start_codon:yes stop_codon:yes gene_type:complete